MQHCSTAAHVWIHLKCLRKLLYYKSTKATDLCCLQSLISNILYSSPPQLVEHRSDIGRHHICVVSSLSVKISRIETLISRTILIPMWSRLVQPWQLSNESVPISLALKGNWTELPSYQLSGLFELVGLLTNGWGDICSLLYSTNWRYFRMIVFKTGNQRNDLPSHTEWLETRVLLDAVVTVVLLTPWQGRWRWGQLESSCEMQRSVFPDDGNYLRTEETIILQLPLFPL